SPASASWTARSCASGWRPAAPADRLAGGRRREDLAGDLTEADPRSAARGGGGDRHLVLVLQEGPDGPIGQGQRFRAGPLTVPEAYMSPVRVEAPFTVIWASICAGVQYMVAKGGRDTTCPFSRTSRARSRPHFSVSAR